MSLNKAAKTLLFMFLISSAVIYFSYTKKDGWFIAYWGVIGTNASILGIIYTIISLNKLKNESEIIINATQDTKKKIGEFNGIANIARAMKLSQEIQGYARSHKYEVGIIRLQELKIIISELLAFNQEIAEIPDLTDTMFSINKLINSMEKEIASKTTNLKIIVVNKKLEETSDLLVKIQISIKARN